MTDERNANVLRRVAGWHDECAARAHRPFGWEMMRHERIARELRAEADRLEAQDREAGQ